MTLLAEAFSGPLALAIVLIAAFAAVYLLVNMLFGTTARARRDKELRRRLSTPVAEPGTEANAVWLPGSFVRLGQRAAVATGFTDRLDEKLDMSGLPIHSGEFFALSVLGGLVGAVAGIVFFQQRIFVMLILTAVGAVVPWVLMSRGIDRRTKRFQGQLADVLSILASSLRSGHSFMQALDTVSQEIGKPASEEFTRVVTETRLGRSVDEALNAMADRIESEDLRWTILAVNIQREVGGNLAEILDTLAATIREREEIRRQVDVLTTEGKISAWILTALPILIAVYLAIINPVYINLLFHTQIGMIMIITGVALLILGALWMRKIVKIDV